MESLGVVTWLWKPHKGYKSKYNAKNVNIFAKMLKRNSTIDYKLFCVTDDPTNIDADITIIPIWSVPHKEISNKLKPNCYRRLKMYSAEAKEIFKVDRLVSFDIDCVITRNVDHLLARKEDFVGWRNVTGVPFQGSLTSHRLGTRTFIWDDYILDPIKAREDAGYYVGSDQAWVSHRMTKEELLHNKKEATFTPKDDGVYSYKKSIRPNRNLLPKNACIVFFHGDPKPDALGMNSIAWIRDNYK